MQYVVDALSQGSVYALCALGIALVFGVMGLINFAYGELMMVGGFALALTSGLPLPVSIAVMVVAVMLTALLTERVGFRPLRAADGETLLVASFGVSFFLQALSIIVFGSLGRGVSVLPGFERGIPLFGVTVRALDLLAIGLTAVLLTILVVLLRFRVGIEMRAAAENIEVANSLGISTNRAIALAFGISGVLAAATALILSAQRGLVDSTFGTTPMLMAFIAMSIGGIGSLPGAVVGGYLVGMISTAFQVLLPSQVVGLRDLFVFGLVLLILVARPQGLFRVRGRAVRI